MKENLVLGDMTRLLWFRSDRAFWPAWEQREADVSLPARVARDEWRARMTEPAHDYTLDPWMIVVRGTGYEPLRDEPALFREFAALPYDRDSYIQFALRYGPLLCRRDEGLPNRLSEWVVEHYRLRRAVSLLESLRTGVDDDLSELGIVRQDHERYSFADLVFRGLLVNEPAAEPPIQVHPRVYSAIQGYEPRVLVGSASSSRDIVRALLAHTVTDMLRFHKVAPSLESDESTLPHATGLRLSFDVQTLAGVMWLQLLLAVDENRTYRVCPVCERWWDATGSRSHKEVCSDKCRAKRSYQARKKDNADSVVTD